MKFATSYFYQIRFFKRNMFPFSTAVYDPKWFRCDKSGDSPYVDRRGVYIGLKSPALMPGDGCSDKCRGPEHCREEGPSQCQFLKAYRKQLDSIDFDKFVQNYEENLRAIGLMLNLTEEPVVVFIVHEAPDNTCSERRVIQEWFADHGVECKELEYPIR